jgi:hypothetical protein
MKWCLPKNSATPVIILFTSLLFIDVKFFAVLFVIKVLNDRSGLYVPVKAGCWFKDIFFIQNERKILKDF